MKTKTLFPAVVARFAGIALLPTAILVANTTAQAAPRTAAEATHAVVRHEKGRTFGWPANSGNWIWGNEILVQYRSGEFQDKPAGSHDINYNKPIQIEQSRSFDGGLTWTQHTTLPIQITEPEFAGPDSAKFPQFGPPLKGVPGLTNLINFADPNTILHFSWGGYLYYSTDRGVTWQGPFQLPLFDLISWQLRTEYPKKGWIECRLSKDNGQTLELASTPVGDEAGTTPPALSRLADGRLVLSYGYRKPARGPASIRSRFSQDQGATWGEELILLTGGGDEDIGDTRQVVRPDGKLVTI
jgi:hypothetical protein